MTDTRKEFEAAIFDIAKSKDYQYMNILFDRYENGDYKKTWVDMAWLGWNLNDKRIQQLLAVIELQRKALQKISDMDYGETDRTKKCKHDKYHWEDCEQCIHEVVDAALAIKPEDVELVEVGEADFDKPDGTVNLDIYNIDFDGLHKLYTIKTKSQ